MSLFDVESKGRNDAFGVEMALFVFAALAGMPLALVLGMRSVRAVRRLDAAPARRVAAEPAATEPDAAAEPAVT